MNQAILSKLSFTSRKIHRISMWFVVGLGIIQAATGLVLKYPDILAFADYSMARSTHNLASAYFTVAFLASAGTGLVMYFVPILIKRTQKFPLPQQKTT